MEWKRWNRKKSQCIEFFHKESSVVENFPIIESKDLKLNWVKKVREDFQNHVKKSNTGHFGEHLSRCPGIFDLFKYGYIIPLSKDIIIKPRGKGFEYQLPSENNNFLGAQPQENVNLIAKPPWTADFIIKIETGWHVIAPKGVKFLMLPIAYPDTFDFTSTVGILDPTVSTQINFQMFWNATEPETVIRVGTPLAHLIPLTEKKYEWVQRVMNQRDMDWVKKIDSAYTSSFWHTTIRGKVVDMYNKHWKR